MVFNVKTWMNIPHSVILGVQRVIKVGLEKRFLPKGVVFSGSIMYPFKGNMLRRCLLHPFVLTWQDLIENCWDSGK